MENGLRDEAASMRRSLRRERGGGYGWPRENGVAEASRRRRDGIQLARHIIPALVELTGQQERQARNE